MMDDRQTDGLTQSRRKAMLKEGIVAVVRGSKGWDEIREGFRKGALQNLIDE